jgi:hypothetical protein
MNAPTRRAMIGTGAAILAAGVPCAAVAASTIGNPDAELIRLCAEHVANLEATNAPGSGAAEWAAYERTRDAISEAKAHTLAGMVAKARAARREARSLDGTESPGGTMAETWSFHIVYDLLRMAGDDVPEPEEIDTTPAPLPPPAEFPDTALMRASADFCAAEAESRATGWAEDNLDNRPGDKAAALARFRVAEATQSAAGRILTQQPAVTLLGLRAKARAAVAWYGDEPPDCGLGADILWSMAKDAAGEFEPAA